MNKKILNFPVIFVMVFLSLVYSARSSAEGPTLTVESYNTLRSEGSYNLEMKFKVVNTGTEPVELRYVWIRYYFTQNEAGGPTKSVRIEPITPTLRGRITSQFGDYHNSDLADEYLQINFTEDAGILAAGESAELGVRVESSDYLQQTNDYSFNPAATSYVPWDKVVGLYRARRAWGVVPPRVTPTPSATTTPTPTLSPTSTSTPRPTPTPSTSPSVGMFTVQSTHGRWTDDSGPALSVRFKIENTGTEPVDLKYVWFRYYFTYDNEVDPDSVYFTLDGYYPISIRVISADFNRYLPRSDLADHYMEVRFTDASEVLQPGEYVAVSGFIRTSDSRYFQQINDYSFNPSAIIPWNKVTGYFRGVRVWGDLPTPTATSTPTSTSTPTPTSTLTPTAASTSTSTVVYPIKELGNCKDQEDCKAYCAKPENAIACIDYAVKNGMMSEEEGRVAKAVAGTNNGPGGCTTKESCAEFCDKPANIDACLNFAEKNNWMSADELVKAKKVAKVLKEKNKTPGGCITLEKCKNYCSDNSHAVECVTFGKSAGLLTAEEAAEAEKVAPLIQSGQLPGGKRTREELEAYCETHREECDSFFEQVGAKKSSGSEGEKPAMLKEGNGPGGCKTKEECGAYCDKNPGDKACGEGAKDAKETIFKKDGGSGPGGCKTKAECDAYCDSHPGECDKQVQQAGGAVKEVTATCSTREECEAFCNDPANKENAACANGTIMIKKDETPKEPTEGQASPIDQLRNDIKAMSPQEQECVKQKIGAEVFDKFVVAGGLPEKPLKREDIQSCMSQEDQPQQSPTSQKPVILSEVLASIFNSLLNLLVK